MPSVSAAQAALERVTPLSGRISVRFHEAAVLSGLPITKIQQLVSRNIIASKKVGRSRLIRTDSLIAFINSDEPQVFKDGQPVARPQRRRVAGKAGA